MNLLRSFNSKFFILHFALAAASLTVGMPVYSTEMPPAWAYPVNPPSFMPSPDDGKPKHVPDSTVTYPLNQLRDFFITPDWHPNDHPFLPAIVAKGRKPDVFACGFCHRADGTGGPENSSLAGLPAGYIAQQLADFKSGMRTTSVPNRAPIVNMISVAKAATDSEIKIAAAYFSHLPPKSVIRVVETNKVPKTYVAGWFLARAKTGTQESIGQRIIETPENLEQFENRDSRSQFIAYVPIGSIAKGKLLVESNQTDKTIRCAICHGANLKGRGLIPSIAGRSPSYIMRQLYDIKTGARAGTGNIPMQQVVAKLNTDDMLAIAAYLATLPP